LMVFPCLALMENTWYSHLIDLITNQEIQMYLLLIGLINLS